MAPVLLGALKLLLAAQATQSTVAGIVRDDETGQPLPGAVVALPDLNRSTATDADGRYLLRDVPAGMVRIMARVIGHAPHQVQALVPQAGAVEINFYLHPEPLLLAAIEVRPPLAVRGADGEPAGADAGREVSSAAVANDPMLAEPDVLQALGGGEVVLKPEFPSGLHVRGGAADQTAYLLDGVPVFSPYHAAGMFGAWNPDAISRTSLSSPAAFPAHPDGLSGTVSAQTRSPGAVLNIHGGFSTTQARLTLDGPLGHAGAGFLVSGRSGFPGFVAPKHDPAYVRGGSSDWLTKVEAPALGGRIRLLGYASDNEINSAAASPDSARAYERRNAFEWHSRSLGAEWLRPIAQGSVRLQVWSAAADALSTWTAPTGSVDMTSARRDEGINTTIERRSIRTSAVYGLRIERSRTSYRVSADSATVHSWSLAARTPVATLFGDRTERVGRRLELTLGASLATATGGLYVAPRARLQWKISERWSLGGDYARSHQFAQSLRNPESVVGNVFPADLYLGAGATGVPVARSELALVNAAYRLPGSLRVRAQLYQNAFEGLLLVAPRTGEPFATGAFTTGSGEARGLSVDAARSTARYGLIARYGWQQLRLEYNDTSYVPDHGTTHLLEAGMVVFPTASLSIRLGATAALGRRTTRVTGGFGSESCNLLDRGCEFGGSPNHRGQPLGGTPLPGYFRVDLGFRKQWSVHVGGREAMLALFGTVTNLFNRRNLLTYAGDPSAGRLSEIELRPRAPLVVGLDWRF